MVYNTNAMKNSKLFKTSIICALYVIFCLILQPFSFGPIQFRLSELLCLLAIEHHYAIIGCTLGCLISNSFFGGLGFIDVVFGSLATLVACFLAYLVRNKKYKNYPILSFLMIVISNAIIVGIEMGFIYNNYAIILISIIEIAISESIVIFVIGLPLYHKLNKLIK